MRALSIDYSGVLSRVEEVRNRMYGVLRKEETHEKNKHFLLFLKNAIEELVIPITNKSAPSGVVVGSWMAMATGLSCFVLFTLGPCQYFLFLKKDQLFKTNNCQAGGITTLRRVTSSNFKAQHVV